MLACWSPSLSSFIRQLSYYGFKRLSDRRRSIERKAGVAAFVIFACVDLLHPLLVVPSKADAPSLAILQVSSFETT